VIVPTPGPTAEQTKRHERTVVWVLWGAQFIAMIGMSACIPFLPLFVRQLGVAPEHESMWSGVITAAPFVMSSMLTPLWGVLGDRYGQKTMVIRAIIGLALAMTLMGFSANIWMLLFLRLFQGAASGFIASTNAFVSTEISPQRLGSSLAHLQTSISAGNIIGPLVGGVISDAVGFREVFWFVGIMCVCSTIIIAFFVKQRVQPSAARPRIGVLETIRHAQNNASIATILIIIFCTQAAIVLSTPIFPYYVEQLGAPTAMLSSISGTIISVVGVCTIIGAPFWSKRAESLGAERTIAIVSGVACLAMGAQAIVPSYHWLYPTRIILGLHTAAIIPLLYSRLTIIAPADQRGGFMGLGSSATLLGNLAGPLLCSAVTWAAPYQATFVLSATILGGICFVMRRQRSSGHH
jgi:MFS transporter, DHA1 family, multidrug resistance protein